MTASRKNSERYTGVEIALHWLMAILIIANVPIGLFHDSILKGTINLHKSIGILLLGLILLRLLWRLTHRMPPLPSNVPLWERSTAKAVEWLLYALMLMLPVSGWIFTSAGKSAHTLTFFGLGPVPPLPVAQGKAVSTPWHEAHVLMGYFIAVLIVLHIAAALKHRFWDRDRTLDRMLPGAGPT